MVDRNSLRSLPKFKGKPLKTARTRESPSKAIAKGRGVRTSDGHPKQRSLIVPVSMNVPSKHTTHLLYATVKINASDTPLELVPNSSINVKKELKDEDFFHGYIERDAANSKLSRSGEFLVRSIVGQDGAEAYEIIVQIGESTKSVPVGYSPIKQFHVYGYRFESMAALVAFHRRNKMPIDEEGTLIRTGIPRDRWLLHANNIKKRRAISSGSTGTIHLASLSVGLLQKVNIALRSMHRKLDAIEKARLQLEVEFIYYFDHPNVLKIFGCCPFDSPVLIAAELATGGSLLDQIQMRPGPSAEDRRGFVLGACTGLAYLESRSIIDKYITACKILLDDKGQVKLSDFGLSILDYDLLEKTKKCIPFRHLAVEVFEKNKFMVGSDVWMFGVLIWEIYNDGQKPYEDAKDMDEVKAAVLGGRRVDNANGAIPTDLYPICVQCFRQKPSDRPTFELIYGMLTA
ncbi:hypothetical protein AB6A40_010933 [Gnathostoma spinigerum]|uniref:Tyrosine-protein kinase n=1 Tax=Gnathostoma spinigerum TaxID=75299 RepID=A0ABD6EW95_9BILA